MGWPLRGRAAIILADMAVFVVIAFRNSEAVAQKVQEVADGKHYPLTQEAWLVAHEGTTQTLAQDLGIRGGESGSGLVLSVQNYSGRASPDVWEWFKLHMKDATT
jgi:hypothetical protein